MSFNKVFISNILKKEKRKLISESNKIGCVSNARNMGEFKYINIISKIEFIEELQNKLENMKKSA